MGGMIIVKLISNKLLIMSQYALYTRFITHTHKGNALIEILMRANQIVSDAKGCRLYIINHTPENKDIIWVTELWDTQEDHAISLTLDGAKELVTEAMPLLASPPEQVALKAVGGKGI